MTVISKELKEKIDLLKKWDDFYYNQNISIVSDEKYDLIKDYIFRKLPPNSKELQELLRKIGHNSSSGWKKESHAIPMGSQNKLSTIEDIKIWWRNIFKKLALSYSSSTVLKSVLQHKIDGFSLEVKYKKGKFSAAITRGNGQIGENITSNAKKFRNLPQVLPIDKDVVIRCEAFIKLDDFDHIQIVTGNRYKNARNAASGISRRFDGNFSEFIHVLAYDINASVDTEIKKIKVLKKLGFETVQTYECLNLKEILDIYDDYKNLKRKKLSYEIDGLVLKLDDIQLQDQLGIQNNRPSGQIALKFNSDQAITPLKQITEQVGRTGKITPVGLLEPVELMGSTVTRATLHNYAWIEANLISSGSEVVIEKKGDIIPQVVDIVTAGEEYKKPEKCPSCRGGLNWDGTNLWCFNEGCKARESARIAYWMKSLDMKGYSESFVDKLWETGKVRNVADLYKLTPDDLSLIDGLGEKTAKGFLKILKSTSNMYLEQFIVALGIPTISKSTAQILVDVFKSWDNILKVTVDQLQNMPGFAEVSAQNTVKGIKEVSNMANKLLQVIKIKEKKKGVFSGLSFCVTGSLEKMSRKEFEAFITDQGGIFKSSVSKSLNYLITNTPESGTGKNEEVIKINKKLDLEKRYEEKIKIITEKEFLNMAGDVSEKIMKEKKEEDDNGLVLETLPLF